MNFVKLIALWVGRAVGAALLLLALCMWLFTPSPDCNPYRLFGCGLFDLGIAGIIGSTLRWFVICVVASIGLVLCQLKPATKQRQDNVTGSSS
jgi:hypothetical protein